MSETWEDAQKNIEKAQSHQKKNYDLRHAVPMFAKGDLVLRKNMVNTHRMGGKLDPKWLGPYKVVEITNKGLYRLQCCKSDKMLKQAISSLQLKPYIERLAQTASGLAYVLLYKQCYKFILIQVKAEDGEKATVDFKDKRGKEK